MFQYCRCKQGVANAKRSMLQENNSNAAYMYVHTFFDTYSNWHVLGLLLCAGVIALCCAVLADLILNNIVVHTARTAVAVYRYSINKSP